MPLEKAVQGARHTGQIVTWSGGDPLVAHDLNGATITGTMRNETTLVTTAITGTLTVTSAAAGIFTWAYSAADVATAGRFMVQFRATYTTYDLTYQEPWVVEAALVVV